MKIIYSLIVAYVTVFLVKQKRNQPIWFRLIRSKVIEDAVLAGGKLYRVDSFPSEYVRARTVDIGHRKIIPKIKEIRSALYA